MVVDLLAVLCLLSRKQLNMTDSVAITVTMVTTLIVITTGSITGARVNVVHMTAIRHLNMFTLYHLSFPPSGLSLLPSLHPPPLSLSLSYAYTFIITLCAYAQQGYCLVVLICVYIYIYIYIYMYVCMWPKKLAV